MSIVPPDPHAGGPMLEPPGDLPWSAAAERNAGPILEVLQPSLRDAGHVLEIGAGTGQHAVSFAAAMPWLHWQATDRQQWLPGLAARIAQVGLPNLPPPQRLDVLDEIWPDGVFDAVYMANTLHIMGWPEVERCFARLPSVMTPGARLVIYGPFRIGGAHTSPSNVAFDADLRARAGHMGIRDLEAVDRLAISAGLRLQADHALPANNRCVVWARQPL